MNKDEKIKKRQKSDRKKIQEKEEEKDRDGREKE